MVRVNMVRVNMVRVNTVKVNMVKVEGSQVKVAHGHAHLDVEVDRMDARMDVEITDHRHSIPQFATDVDNLDTLRKVVELG